MLCGRRFLQVKSISTEGDALQLGCAERIQDGMETLHRGRCSAR